MKLNTTLKPIVLALGLGLASMPYVSQAEGNWYVGVGAGKADIDERGLDDDDTAFKANGGYRFSDYFGVELGYVDLGDLEDGRSRNALEVDGVSIGAVGTLPINDNFSLHGKVGTYFWDLDATGAVAAQFSDDSDNDIYFGGGVRYEFDNNVSLVGEWERYEIDDLDVDLFSVGVAYSF